MRSGGLRSRNSTLALLQVAVGIALFLAVDGAIFRSGLYAPWVAPTSGVGAVLRVVDGISRIPLGHRSVLVLGDSRIAEGFSASLATTTAAASGSALTFTSGGVPGTLPRVWYYILRQVEHPAARLAAVAIMTTSYHDDVADALAGRRSDILFAHPLLRLSDLPVFPPSFPTRPEQLEAAEAILFAGLFYKADLQDFIADPAERIRQVLAWRAHGREWIANYQGNDGTLAGLGFDLQTGALSVASEHASPRPAALAAYAANLRANHGRFADSDAAAAYRREWFGRIAALCRHAGIPLIVFRIPRGPLHHMVDADAQPTGVLEAMAQAGELKLLPADTFDSLEWPQYFFDDLHLNHAGRQAFSVALARAVLASKQQARGSF